MAVAAPLVVPFAELGVADVARVGGKNASLGEMIRHLSPAGIRVPDGFATTADAYRRFLQANDLAAPIAATLAGSGGAAPAVAHIAEVLDASIRGLPLPALAGR